jgi:Protein of unknown function (DUF3551)
MTMRAGVGAVLGVGAILIATSAWGAGRYDPAYPVCLEAYDDSGTRTDCVFTSIEQCRQTTSGSPGTCFNNPGYVAPAPEPVAAAEPAPPPVKPAKKPAKSAKNAKSQPLPPAPSQQR